MPRTPPDLADVLDRLTSLKRRRPTRLVTSQVDTLERRAQALSAPVYSLPVELLSYIFVLAASQDDNFPLTASAVSSAWRAVARGYAPLWADVKLRLPKPKSSLPSTPTPEDGGPEDGEGEQEDEEDVDVEDVVDEEDEGGEEEDMPFSYYSAPFETRQRQRLSHHLTLSRQSSLHLDVEYAAHSRTSALLKLVHPHIPRCKSLKLWNRGPALPRLGELLAVPAGGMSMLRVLDLAGFCLRDVGEALDLLRQAPALKVLAIRDVHFIPPPALPLPTSNDNNQQILSLLQLNDLLIDEPAPYLLSLLLPLLYTPNLRSLTLSTHTCDPKRLSYISLRPPVGSWGRVKLLRVRGCAWDNRAVLGLLGMCMAVEGLVLQGTVVTDLLLDALSRPIPTRPRTDASLGGGAVKWLAPRLGSAYLHTRARFSREAVMRFVDARLPVPIPRPAAPGAAATVKPVAPSALPATVDPAVPGPQTTNIMREPEGKKNRPPPLPVGTVFPHSGLAPAAPGGPLTPMTPSNLPNLASSTNSPHVDPSSARLSALAAAAAAALPIMPLPPTPTSPYPPGSATAAHTPTPSTFTSPHPPSQTHISVATTAAAQTQIPTARPGQPQRPPPVRAPTPLRLLGIFGLQHTPTPTPALFQTPSVPVAATNTTNQQNANPANQAIAAQPPPPSLADAAFRAWLTRRIGPETRTFPIWNNFRRTVVQRFAAAAAASGGGGGFVVQPVGGFGTTAAPIPLVAPVIPAPTLAASMNGGGVVAPVVPVAALGPAAAAMHVGPSAAAVGDGAGGVRTYVPPALGASSV